MKDTGPVTITVTPDQAVSILDAIGCAGIVVTDTPGSPLDLNIDNWEGLEKTIFLSFSAYTLAKAQAARHESHEGEDTEAIFLEFLGGYSELRGSLFPTSFPAPEGLLN